MMKNVVKKLSFFSIFSLFLAAGVYFAWISKVSFHDPNFINISRPYIWPAIIFLVIGILIGITAITFYIKDLISKNKA